MDRRRFLCGLLAAPAVVRTPGLLMPVKPRPETFVALVGGGEVRAEAIRMTFEEFDRLFKNNAVRNLRVGPERMQGLSAAACANLAHETAGGRFLA